MPSSLLSIREWRSFVADGEGRNSNRRMPCSIAMEIPAPVAARRLDLCALHRGGERRLMYVCDRDGAHSGVRQIRKVHKIVSTALDARYSCCGRKNQAERRRRRRHRFLADARKPTCM